MATTATTSQTYTLATDSYNERRYGKPWIAEINGKDFAFGDWIGRIGCKGELSIDAKPGAIIGTGQKDHRKGRGGVDNYYMAMPNGKLWGKYIDGPVDADKWRKAGWRAYAEMRMNDTATKNDVRILAAKMLRVQDPFSKIAAEFFGLVKPAPAKPAPVAIDLAAFGL
jgi:hypothetical protein